MLYQNQCHWFVYKLNGVLMGRKNSTQLFIIYIIFFKMSKTLRNYQIRQKLGSGSYGVIYKALNKIDKSICVLKQIALSRMSQKAKKNAVNEAHIMGKLKHPFIVCYYQSFTEDNNLNILMEFCDGGDLSYFLKQQNKKFIKQEKIWKFFIQICMGLQHIHKNKILHRDIKTLNIFLNKNQTVKIGDLGVAKMLNSNDFAHTMVGTPFYLSPQLCQQKPYNEKSDIWALGCLLYQLCTFRHPFQAANQASLILKIIRGKYQPIPQFYSKQLRQIIGACLQRDYKRRPTCNMILSKPNIKKMMEDFQLNKIVDQFYKNPSVNAPPPQNMKPQQKIIENKPPVTKVENKLPAQKPKKVLDEAPPVRQVIKVAQIDELKQKKAEVNQNENLIINKRRQSQAALNVKPNQKIQKVDKQKILFGSENKDDFISALEMKVKDSKQEKKIQSQKRQVIKKNHISFQIPWKDAKKKQQNNQPEGKIIIHNKNALISDSVSVMQQKNSQVIQKVKMEKKIQPRIYEVNKQNQRPIGIIKSGGFSQAQQRPQTCFDRKKAESNELKSDKKISQQKPSFQKHYTQHKNSQKQYVNSTKNLRKNSQQRQVYLPQIKPEGQKVEHVPHYPPKMKKIPQPIPQEQILRKPPKHLPHKSTSASTSVSRFTDITKQQQHLVANLPDKVKKYKSDSDSDEEKKSSKNGPCIKFKDIDDQKVLKMYEQLLSSSRQTQQVNNQDEYVEEELMQQSTQLKNQNFQQNNEQIEQQMQRDQLQEDSDLFYQINKYEGQLEPQQKKVKNSEWQFDEQPQLPMLQQSETPLFEEANPYLVQQSEQGEQEQEEQQQKSQREFLIEKRQHLQIKLKENIKREDEINRLMQLKIQQCKSVVPKNFDEILNFFRSKINMEKQYTEEDEKQVESFLAKRNLTDQRKFQNIYKIMHFEMELENTRRIIQSICKKLNELQKQIKQCN